MENYREANALIPKEMLISALDDIVGGRNSWLTNSFVQAELETWGNRQKPLDWTRQFFWKFCKENEGTGDKPFISNPLTLPSVILGQAAQTELSEQGRLSDLLAETIAQWAQTDCDTFTLAQMLVEDAATVGPPLPEPLHALGNRIVNGGRPPKKKSPRSWKLLNRNRFGVGALHVLTHAEGFNLSPTRSVATEGISGCDILADATSGLSWASITASGADEIWRDRKRWSLEWHLLLVLSYFLQDPSRGFSTEFALHALKCLKSVSSGRKMKNEPDE